MKFTLAISVLKSQITLKIFYLEIIIEIQIVCILTEKATRLTRLPFVILVKLESLDLTWIFCFDEFPKYGLLRFTFIVFASTDKVNSFQYLFILKRSGKSVSQPVCI